MRANSDQTPADKIRLLAGTFLLEAWELLRSEHVVPASRFRPYLRVGSDYEGQPLMGLASFTALETALFEHFPNRFEEPLKAQKPEFPNHYIFRLLEAYIAHSAKVGNEAEGAATASIVVDEFLSALSATEYSLVSARLVSHVTTATMEPIEIDGLVVRPLRQPSYEDRPIAAISKLIPDAGRAFRDGPPFAHDPPTSLVIVQEASGEVSESVATRLARRGLRHRRLRQSCAVLLQRARTEGVGDHLVDRFDARHRVEQHAWCGVFEEQLAATPAGHERIPLAVDARECDELAAPGHVQRGDEGALGTQSEAVRGVLDVRARDDAAVVNDGRDANGEVGVGRVGVRERLLGDPAQGIPVGVSLRNEFTHDLMYGFPEAAGPRT